MNTRGRPKGLKYNKPITIRISRQQYKSWNDKAKRLGLSLSGLIKSKMDAVRIRDKDVQDIHLDNSIIKNNNTEAEAEAEAEAVR